MADENKESGASENVTKKSSTSTKKVKAEKSKSTGMPVKKKKVIEKLKAMGIMRSEKSDAAENDNAEHASFFKLTSVIVIVVTAVGSLVWVLNKEVNNEQVASNANNVQQANYGMMPPAAYPTYPGAWHPSSSGQNNNANYKKQQERLQQQRAQQQKWMQQYQEAQKQQRAQQQKWAQQQQQALQQYRIQQQKWADQQQVQQRAQQQKWAQQQQVQQPQYQQQPYYGYSQYGNNSTSVPTYYNYQPGYQQPGQYYRR
jgi:hypothetical protein